MRFVAPCLSQIQISISDMNDGTALVILDLQVGNFDPRYPIFEGERLISTAKILVQRARSANIPIIYILNNGPEGEVDEPYTSGWEVHPEITPFDNDVQIQKTTPDAFHKTELKVTLDSLGIKRLIIAGLQTEFCIDTTCRRGSLLGYDIVLVKDGHSTWDSEILPAQKIIEHHNRVLGDWFVELSEADEIEL